MEDDELLRRCQRSDEAALEDLIERFQQRIYRLALRVLADPGRAEEAASEALTNVWFRCGSWRGESSAGTWIHQVALRTVLDHARRRKRWWRFWEAADRSSASSDDDPARILAGVEHQRTIERQVLAMMNSLPPDDRALVHWHYFEQQPLAEIAEVMGVSRDALKMRLSRLRQRLRETWKDLDE